MEFNYRTKNNCLDSFHEIKTPF